MNLDTNSRKFCLVFAVVPHCPWFCAVSAPQGLLANSQGRQPLETRDRVSQCF